MVQTYTPPVARLLEYEPGKAVKADEWVDYRSEFDLATAHIPDLLRLMQDEVLLNLIVEELPSDWPQHLDPELALWAPIHAWRALAQLQAVEFAEGAIAVLNSDALEWAQEEFPEACRLIGPQILDPLGNLIREHAKTEQNVNTLIESVYRLPEQYPETRDRCVALLQDCLASYEQNNEETNTFLILGLQELKAVEAVDLLEAVHKSKRLIEFIVGTWAQTQIELGLKTPDDFTKAELTPEVTPEFARLQEYMQTLERLQKPDAFTLGLPLDPDQLPSTKPPGFDDMLKSQKSTQTESQKGFGGAKKSAEKGKNKKSKGKNKKK